MQTSMKAAVAALVLCSLTAVAPAGAADDMGAKPDCSKANAMMQTGHMMTADATNASPDPNQSVDQSFAKAMLDMRDHMMAFAKLEVACGKDAGTKAQANKFLSDPAYTSLQFKNIVP